MPIYSGDAFKSIDRKPSGDARLFGDEVKKERIIVPVVVRQVVKEFFKDEKRVDEKVRELVEEINSSDCMVGIYDLDEYKNKLRQRLAQ